MERYVAVALQPLMRGCNRRSEIKANIEHIAELMAVAVNYSGTDFPVRLVALPEGALQGFTDEIFDWPHERYAEEMAIDVPGEETNLLAELARHHNTYLIAQAKVRHPEFPRRFFNSAFILSPTGEVIHQYYKLNVFQQEHSLVPHDVWDRWVELYGAGLNAFYPVAHTPIGRIGTIVCMDGSFPETARGLAMNGAEIIYRPSYPEPSVSSGLWEVQNRARALDNNCYVIAPNLANYHITPNSPTPIDCFGGQTMIIDYHGQILCVHTYGGSASYTAATIDIQTLRDFRVRSLGTNWFKELRTEQYRLIYDQPIYPKNLRLTQAPPDHAAHEKLRRELIEELVERGTWAPPPRDPETS